MANQPHSPKLQHSHPKKAFQVYIRVRPPKPAEQQQCKKFQRPQNAVTVQGNKILLADPDSFTANYTKQYEFYEVFNDEASNQTIYDRVIHEQIQGLCDGLKSTTILAYGQTGAGKTHTIFGNEQDGLIFRILETLMQQNQPYKMSYLEIYNEKVKDLLISSTTPEYTVVAPQIIDNGPTNVIVQGLQWVDLTNIEEALDCLVQGNLRRTTAETQHNVQSSRSHALIQITSQANDAQLIVIDLAGSERCTNSTKLSTSLQHEGSNINKSLLALTNCIKILSDQKSLKQHIPYRDSKLTRLLKSSLMGHTNTLMIACISPTWLTYDETINTLGYAQRAGMIKSKIVQCIPKDPHQHRISIQEKHQTQIQQLCQKDEDFNPKKQRYRSHEKNFVEMNKQALTSKVFTTKSRSPNTLEQRFTRQYHSAKTPRRTLDFASKSLQKSRLDISLIQQTDNDLMLDSSSIMDLLQTIDDGLLLKKARRKSSQSDFSVRSRSAKPVFINTLSAERFKFLSFKKMLDGIHKSISTHEQQPTKQAIDPELLHNINSLLSQFKLHKWILQGSEDHKLKMTINFAHDYLYRGRPVTAKRKKSLGFQF